MWELNWRKRPKRANRRVPLPRRISIERLSS
jgi:hypothetical protein